MCSPEFLYETPRAEASDDSLLLAIKAFRKAVRRAFLETVNREYPEGSQAIRRFDETAAATSKFLDELKYLRLGFPFTSFSKNQI